MGKEEMKPNGKRGERAGERNKRAAKTKKRGGPDVKLRIQETRAAREQMRGSRIGRQKIRVRKRAKTLE